MKIFSVSLLALLLFGTGVLIGLHVGIDRDIEQRLERLHQLELRLETFEKLLPAPSTR